MGYFEIFLGALLIVIVLLDTFETIVLPRTVSRPLRLTRLYFDFMWKLWSVLTRLLRAPARRDGILSAFGPFALIMLIALWATLLIFGFALMLHGGDAHLTVENPGFGEYLYLSSVTFFTLGFGDITAVHTAGRIITMIEAGVGFGFLALVIGYLPVLYQSFSRREATILLLDARAGSPPVASELLRRYAQDKEGLQELLFEFEKWAAQLLESYLSYPMLAFYRSQHDRQTWIGALTAMLDATTLIRLAVPKDNPEFRPLIRQAEMTYAMSRHVIVDLAYLLNTPPRITERLTEEDRRRLILLLRGMGLDVSEPERLMRRLDDERLQYEPYLGGLSDTLFLPLPGWVSNSTASDNWRTTAWDGKGHF